MKKILDSSWDFRGSNTKYLTHGIHTYPAMMIPQIAERLIRENLNNGKVVLDPFCGSGTALVESMRINNKSYGIDINPLAIMIAKAKTTPIEPEKLSKASKEILMKLNFNQVKSYEIPQFFNLDFWFKKNIIKQLSIIKKVLDDYKIDKHLYNFLLSVFSETVRKSSNVRSGEYKLYRIPEELLGVYNPNAFQIFEKSLMKAVEGMKKFHEECRDSVKPEILMTDVRKKFPIKDKIDLVVTSPPYGDSRTTVAYGQFSRLSLQWLGIEPESVIKNIDKLSLGGIRYENMDNVISKSLEIVLKKISRTNPTRALDVYSFNCDLLKCMENIVDHISNNGKLCFVLGNRTVAGVQIPTDDILVEFGKSLGLTHLSTIIRNIPSKRIPIQNSPSNKVGVTGRTMTKEHIAILKKS